MKKLITICLTFFTISAFGQQKTTTIDRVHKHPSPQKQDISLKSKLAGPYNYYLSETPKIGHSTKQGQSVETLIGHSANVFMSLGDVRSLINYNEDINTMTFLYRQDPVEYGNVGNVGWMRYSVSKDGGTTWTENNGLLWDESAGFDGRYPNGFLYNPSGNTIADSAYQVWLGPTLVGTNDGWGGMGYGSHKIGESGTTSTDQGEFSDPNNNTNYLIPDGGTFANDKVWVLESAVNLLLGASGVYQDTLALYEGTIQNGAVDFIRRPIYMPVDMGPDNPFSWQIAFAPDGQTGYIVGLGRLDSVTYPKNSSNIIHMKTTDGGQTWSAPSEVYYADDTLITNNIGDSANAVGPQCASGQFELDLVVDTFGNPHTLFNIEWRPDTAYGFTYVGRPSTIWHVYSPDGGTSWDFNRVATTQLRYGIIGTGAGSNATQENRPQLSRDPNGRYVTMAWFDTDTALQINPTPCTGFGDGYCGNSDRFINTAGYNVAKDFYTPVKSWDFFLQGSYTSNYEAISEIAPFDGSKLTIPYEYMKIDDKNVFDSPVDHYYESGVSYTKEELGDTTSVGLGNAIVSADQLKLFPNPTNSELNIIISDSDLGNEIKVFNSLGQLVMRSAEHIKSDNNLIYKLDVSTLNEGIYLVKMDNSNVSTRFIKQ